jgi:hypothetical protein
MTKSRKDMTDEELRAECYRLVEEHEAKLTPYELALFHQRLERCLFDKPKLVVAA